MTRNQPPVNAAQTAVQLLHERPQLADTTTLAAALDQYVRHNA